MNESNGNVVIENVTVTESNQAGSVVIGFDARWSDSWRFADGRRSNNWDAAWIFVKYQALMTQTIKAPLPLQADLIARALDNGDARPLVISAGPPKDDDLLAPGDHVVTVTTEGRSWGMRQDRRTPLVSEPGKVEIFSVTRAGNEFLVSGTSSFKHAKLVEVTALPRGGTIDVAADGLGLFLYRASPGQGDALFQGIQIRCEPFHARFPMGVSDPFTILGVQMVFIPEGSFAAGDPKGPDGPPACFYDSRKDSGDLTYEVTSEDAIPLATGAPFAPKGFTWQTADAVGNPGDLDGPIPHAFPKGYQAFYLMRSHITEEQYRAFINTLPGPARTQRFSYWFGESRYNIYMLASGKRVALRPNRSCNWLSWMDGAAFACWAGLRPMTELEFEKASRGPLPAKTGEYAWGSTRLVQAQVIVGDEDDRMFVQGNASFGGAVFIGGDGGSGPVPDDAYDAAFGTGGDHRLRGAFGTGSVTHHPSQSSDASLEAKEAQLRENTGASYYGVMGLSGNLWEYCVTVGNPSGRSFLGNNGTGDLNHFGNFPGTTADKPGGILGWPGLSVWGVGNRGGSWYTASNEIRLADRTYGSGLEGYTSRSNDTGFRCARTAPKSKSAT
jgi:formylglycine-generating enzyme required for sulfatase activity